MSDSCVSCALNMSVGTPSELDQSVADVGALMGELNFEEPARPRISSISQSQDFGGSANDLTTIDMGVKTDENTGDVKVAVGVAEEESKEVPLDDTKGGKTEVPLGEKGGKMRKTSEAFTIQVHCPELRGTNMVNKHHAYRITSPVLYTSSVGTAAADDGMSHEVFRRYNDFVWLRTELTSQFPGVFIPPLPPKKFIGHTAGQFVAERQKLLGRFLNNCERLRFLRKSNAFRIFLTEHNSEEFERRSKEITRDASSERANEQLQRLLEFFPYLQDLPQSNPEDQANVDHLKEYIERIEAKLSQVTQTCDSLVKEQYLLAESFNRMNNALQHVHNLELEYPGMPQRVNFLDTFMSLQNQAKLRASTNQSNLFMHLQQELWDSRAFLETIEAQKAMKAAELKKKDYNADGGSQEQKLLETVTMHLLNQQLSQFWKQRMERFRSDMQELAQDHASILEDEIDTLTSILNL